tara:strand:+ start:321 stop:926 length:606 start_codon:yes stop_codon:yes gene_type:complete
MNERLIGLTGFARSGKDTFYNRSKIFLSNKGLKSSRFAFADVLKSECDLILKRHLNISAFTEDSLEKELIRPLLVTWGTEIRRKIDPFCWINAISSPIEERIASGEYVFITDVRFKNEVEWIKSQGGLIFNIKKEGGFPANKDELDQSKLIKPLTDINVLWPQFSGDQIQLCDPYVSRVLNLYFDKNILQKNLPKWTIYGK